MSYNCLNTCGQYRGVYKKYKGESAYTKGFKRCSICDIIIDYEGLYCPCCSVRLSSRPRGKGRKKIEVKRY